MNNFKCDFMIIGAMKCATTSLADALAKHPDVGFSNPKEPHFFSSEQNWKENISTYHNMFQDKTKKIYGEGTTSYTKFPYFKLEVYNDLFEYNPDLKFIYALRHPIHRAISQYIHMYVRRIINCDFMTAIRTTDIINTSRYYTQLKPYFDLFGRDHFLLYLYEDFVENQNVILHDVASFLEIDSNVMSDISAIHANKSIGDYKIGKSLEKFKTPIIRNVWDNSIPVGIKTTIYKLLSKITTNKLTERPVLTIEQELIILNLMRLDILEMEKVLNRDLTFYLTTTDGKKCVR